MRRFLFYFFYNIFIILFFSLFVRSDLTEKTLIVSKTGTQTRVSGDVSTGKTILVYEDSNCFASGTHICLYTAGTEEKVNELNISAAYPGVKADADDIFVVWADTRTPNESWNIYFRKKEGSNWKSTMKVSSTSSSDVCKDDKTAQISPSISVSGNDVYITWQDFDQQGTSRICFVRSQSRGLSFLPNKLLASGGYLPSIASSATRVVIAYSDVNGNVYFIKSQDGGDSFSGPQKVANAITRLPDLSDPDIEISPSGRIIVAWQDKVTGGTDIDIFITYSDDDGTTWSAPQRIQLSGDQKNPSISYSSGIWIFFEENYEIYYLRTKGSLKLSEGPNNPQTPMSVLSGTQGLPALQVKLQTFWETQGILDPTEDILIKGVNVSSSGTGNDANDITVDVYSDEDADAAKSATDIYLGSFSFSVDNGTATFTKDIEVKREIDKYLLFLINTKSQTPPNRNYKLSLSSSGISAVGKDTGFPISVSPATTVNGREILIYDRAPIAYLTISPNPSPEGGTDITLDASASYDPDDKEGIFPDPITFIFQQVSGPTVTISGTGSKRDIKSPQVTQDSSLVFKVQVYDSFNAMTEVTSTLTVLNTVNEAPVSIPKVKIGDNLVTPPVTVDEGSVVNLDGSLSYDPNGDEISYLWFQTAGPAILIRNQSSASADFVAPGIEGASETTVKITLSVADSKGAFSQTEISIIVKNTANDPPTAKFTATPNQGFIPFTVFFDGSQSSDPDGLINLYTWDFGDGEVVTGTAKTINHTYNNSGEFVARLRVQDNVGATSEYVSKITALSTLPSILISENQKGSPYVLNGVESFLWQLKLSTGSDEPVIVDSISFSVSGEQPFKINIAEDRDLSGTISTADKIFGTFTSQQFSINPSVEISNTTNVYIVITGQFFLRANYTLSVVSASGKGKKTSTSATISISAQPLSIFVQDAMLFFSPLPIQDVTVTNTQYVKAFDFEAEAQADNFIISGFTLEYDQNYVKNLTFYIDKNLNGIFDSQDTIIFSGITKSPTFSPFEVKNGEKARISAIAQVTTSSASAPPFQIPIFLLFSLITYSMLFKVRQKEIYFVLTSLLLFSFYCARGTGTVVGKAATGQQAQQPITGGDQQQAQQPVTGGDQQQAQQPGQQQGQTLSVFTFQIQGVSVTAKGSSYWQTSGLPIKGAEVTVVK